MATYDMFDGGVIQVSFIINYCIEVRARKSPLVEFSSDILLLTLLYR